MHHVDDFLSIHDAIQSLQGSGVIVLGDGDYFINSTIVLSSGQSIVGQGSTRSRLIWEGEQGPVISIHGEVGERVGEIASNSNERIKLKVLNGFNQRGVVGGLNKPYFGPVRIYSGRSPGVDAIPLHEYSEIINTNGEYVLKNRLQLDYGNQAEVFKFYPSKDNQLNNFSILGEAKPVRGIEIFNSVNVEIERVNIAGVQTGIYIYSKLLCSGCKR